MDIMGTNSVPTLIVNSCTLILKLLQNLQTYCQAIIAKLEMFNLEQNETFKFPQHIKMYTGDQPFNKIFVLLHENTEGGNCKHYYYSDSQ